MISPSAFVAAMQRCGINFATGVPDSLLKEVCAEIEVGMPVGGQFMAPHFEEATMLRAAAALEGALGAEAHQ